MTETYTAPESLLKNVPPHSLDAERAVLGAMLIDPRAIDDVAEVVTPEHFYKAAHAAIYTVILELYKLNQPVDVVLVNEELQRKGELDKVGGTSALVQLTETVPTSANAAYYAEVVRDYACRRQLIQVVAEIQRDTFEDRGQTEELLDRTERRLFEVTQKRIRSEAVPVSAVVQEAFERLELVRKGGGVVGQPSGLSDLDDLTQGFQPGEMTILAARPSMGKCLAWDTEVLLADGRLMTMAEVYAAGRTGSDAVRLLTLGADWRFRAVEPSAWVDDGQKPVFRVTTKLGREIETTLTHPFLTPGGWRPLGELGVGERVAVPRRLEVFGDQPVAARELDRLAAVLAEGGELPARTFSLPREQLRELLGPILAGALPPAWSRERPARQVQHLLLRFGVLSALREDRGEWRLSLVEDDGGNLTEGTGSRRGGVATARSTQVHWDTITAIEPMGLKQVYDLTVPETHNFVAADVCVHNTTLALNILRNVTVYHGRSAVFFSLEMPRLQVTTNLLCGLAKIDGHRLRGGYLTREEERQFLDAAEVLMPAQLYIDDTPGLSTMDLRAKARRLKAQKGIDLIMIDYLQLMSGSAVSARESRQQEVSEISRMTKALARELSIPIIALAQLSRKVEERKDHKPMMSDLRESGSIEQDADLIMLLHRPGYYEPEKEELKNQAQLIVAKNRNGPIGEVPLLFFNNQMRFESSTRG